MENFSTINKLVHIFSSEGRVVWVRLERMKWMRSQCTYSGIGTKRTCWRTRCGRWGNNYKWTRFPGLSGAIYWQTEGSRRSRAMWTADAQSPVHTTEGSRLGIRAPPRSEPEGPWGPKAMQRGKISSGVWQLSSWWFRMRSRVVWLQRSVFQVEGWWINWAECYWDAKWGKVRYRWNIHENQGVMGFCLW